MKQSIAVELKALRKVFGFGPKAVIANSDISMVVRSGTIHGIVGENGAGKSTAMKMLYGLYAPDSGEIWVHGEQKKWSSPSGAIAAGIGMVHQHFMLAGPLTALDNVLLGLKNESVAGKWSSFLPAGLRPFRRQKVKAELEALAEQYGLEVPFEAKVETLPVGIQQRLEILKLLYRKAEILILDEPTAVLTPQETEELFKNLRKLKAAGKTLLIITHKLKEVMSLTDRITVFRGGRISGDVDTQETSPQQLADFMVGRKVLLQVHVPPPLSLAKSDLVLDVSGLCLTKKNQAKALLANISFSLRPGEIVGIAGVEGNGQNELIRALMGQLRADEQISGEIKLMGQSIVQNSTLNRVQAGISLIPEDRHKEALLLNKNLAENFLLGIQWKREFQNSFGKFFGISWKKVNKAAQVAFESYDVRPNQLELLAKNLSGGNQQKLVAARAFYTNPKLLIACQPTRGVDVGAIEFIHNKLVDHARQAQAAVLLVSSELDEIISLSDRILVVYGGQVVAQFGRGEASEKTLGLKMGGAKG